MSITVSDENGITIIKVSGDLDLGLTEELEKTLGNELSPEKNRIVFDLSGTPGITSKAIGLLMWAKAEAKGSGGDVFLMSPHPKVLSLLKLIGLGEVLETVEDADEAFGKFN